MDYAPDSKKSEKVGISRTFDTFNRPYGVKVLIFYLFDIV